MPVLDRPCRCWFSARVAWSALALLLAVAAPLFLCMPVWLDVTFYDMAARNLLHGGVHYRDVFDTNLPGIVWLHALIRAAFGWRSETIRLVDGGIVSVVVWLLIGWLRRAGLTLAARSCAVLGFVGFYLSTTEMVHCQRDVWMIVPALAALGLRRRQSCARTPASLAPLCGIAEGLCWGAAFWIKPFVAVTAVACWLLTAASLARAGWRRVALDAATVLTGGLLAALAGVMWLWLSGSWPFFWEVFVVWNPDYLRTSEGKPLLRLIYPLAAFYPWGAVHLVAVPAALISIGRALKARETAAASSDANELWEIALFGVFYLGWLFQAAFLQTPYDYVLAPAFLLGIAVAAICLGRTRLSRTGLVVLTGFAALAIAHHSLLRLERTALWSRCLREGSTPELRDRLSLAAPEKRPRGWEDLERVAGYLRGLGLRNGELTCYDNATHSLYLDLQLQPSTRFLHFDTILDRFPHHHDDVRRALSASHQRIVVSDLRRLGLGEAAETSAGARPELPAGFPVHWSEVFPWYEPIMFRSGRFVVHRVTRPVGPLMPGPRSIPPMRAGMP